MESTKCTPSVIVKLMGLDDQLPQRPVLKRQRVLSESYLQKSAILGTYGRSVLYSFHSSSIATSKKKLKQNEAEQEKLLSGAPLTKRETTLRFYSHNEPRWTKLGPSTHSFRNGSSIGRLGGKQIFEKWRKAKTSETTKLYDIRCNVDEILISTDNELQNIKSCQKSSQHSPTFHSCNSFGSISNNYLKGEEVLLSDIDEHCNFSASPKASQSIIELGSDTSVDGRGSKLCHEEPDVFPCHNLENHNMPGHVICRLSSASDLYRDSDIKLPFEGGQVIHDEKECGLVKNAMLQDSSLVKSIPHYISESTTADHQRNEISISPSQLQELLSDALMKQDSPSEVWATSSIQTSPYYINEEGFAISNLQVDSEFSRKSRDVNQPSPNSVLEPHLLEENTLVSEILGSAGDVFYDLAMEFHCLNSKSEETYSDGSELDVSSDEDSGEVSFHFSHETEKRLELYRTEESRNFSYLLDILDEAELTCINSEHYLKAWNSMDYLVDPPIFEALEKKYGKQTSWEKSERRLLFDRINVGLKEILNIQIGICSFERPLRRSFTATLGRNELEEELWMFLTSEEKDACNDLSTKGLGNEIKWLQLSEDIQNICRDIEYDLFNEIVGEIVTISDL